jgi:phosphopantetheine--protein transferase-like protein
MAIYGIGIDIVEVARFENWHTKPLTHLKKIFTTIELNDCFERYSEKTYPLFFASRFAAKEAFFKALSQALVTLNYEGEFPSFAQIRTLCSITKHHSGVPLLEIEWKKISTLLYYELPPFQVFCSISHEKIFALSQVTLCIRQ